MKSDWFSILIGISIIMSGSLILNGNNDYNVYAYIFILVGAVSVIAGIASFAIKNLKVRYLIQMIDWIGFFIIGIICLTVFKIDNTNIWYVVGTILALLFAIRYCVRFIKADGNAR
jgi:hypothetical protein